MQTRFAYLGPSGMHRSWHRPECSWNRHYGLFHHGPRNRSNLNSEISPCGLNITIPRFDSIRSRSVPDIFADDPHHWYLSYEFAKHRTIGGRPPTSNANRDRFESREQAEFDRTRQSCRVPSRLEFEKDSRLVLLVARAQPKSL